MKKILHTVNVPFVIPFILGEQINYFSKVGYDIHIACSPGVELQKYSKKWNFRLIELHVNRKISIFDDLKSIIILFKYIKKNKIEVVVGHTPKGALISMISAYLCNVKKRIYFRHGLVFETSKGLKRYLLIFIEKITSMLSTEVLCVSKSVQNQSIKYKLTNKSKLFILNNGSCNGVDALGKFNKKNILVQDIDELYSKLGLTKNNIIIGFVGRLSKDKGINELIIAWEIVKKRNINVKLILCGPIDERDPIQNTLLNKIQNDPSICITGEINDTYLYYSIFDIFILPSYREGFPTVVLEASSMELPIITTRVTGCVDSIVENSTGIFSEINSNSISEKIQFYIDNPSISKAHGKNARTFILKNYLEEDIWRKLEYFYNS